VGSLLVVETEDLVNREVEGGADPERSFQRGHDAAVLYPIEVALRESCATGEVVLAQVPSIQDPAKLVLHVARA
jgi:hypothetical protein